MCLIAWNWQPRSQTPLLLLSNRDEFYARPAQALHWWGQTPNGAEILGGKDLQAGGTWLGVSRSGRLAALTNYRTPEPARTNTSSRGELVANFLQDHTTVESFLNQLSRHTDDYNPFNLLVFDGQSFMGLESRGSTVIAMEPGIGAVSNANFQTPWPKLTRLTRGLASKIEQGQSNTSDLLALLHDQKIAADADLPQTGIELDLERMLSATFITSPAYGTRACSVVAIHNDHTEFTEQAFDAEGLLGQSQQHFAIVNRVIRSSLPALPGCPDAQDSP